MPPVPQLNLASFAHVKVARLASINSQIIFLLHSVLLDHNTLLDKLAHYGVREIENNWFKTYLTNRKQHVTVSGQTSDNALIEFGVPQGSVLGPLLFLIYINDLNQAIKFSRVHHFADDTNLLLVDNSLKKRSKHINHDLKLLTAWLRANRISLNTSKIKILLFRPKSKRNITKHLNFTISVHYISQITQIKYLELATNEHLDKNELLCSRCSKLEDKVVSLESLVNQVEQYGRKNNIVLTDIPNNIADDKS